MDLKEAEILGDQIGEHWYYRAKANALKHSLRGWVPSEILDIGAGSGFFSRQLLEENGVELATCVDTGYKKDWQETHAGKPIFFKRRLKQTGADLVLLMDVLEHVDNERALLSPYVDAVPSGTRFLITVPAFNFLWSGHDVFLEHRRRYTINTLIGAMEGTGLNLISSHYYYAAVFPLAASVRLFDRIFHGNDDVPRTNLRKHNILSNRLLAALCAIERPLMRFNRLFGLSVFAMFRKT